MIFAGTKANSGQVWIGDGDGDSDQEGNNDDADEDDDDDLTKCSCICLEEDWSSLNWWGRRPKMILTPKNASASHTFEIHV